MASFATAVAQPAALDDAFDGRASRRSCSRSALPRPMFWMARAVRTDRRADAHGVAASSAASFLSSALGILQVYYPDTFLPPEFSALGAELNPEIVSSLTYRRCQTDAEIIRPPGLSDMPGGAAVAGMVTVMLGLSLALPARASHGRPRAGCVAAATIGMTALLSHAGAIADPGRGRELGVFAPCACGRGAPAKAWLSLGVGAALVAGVVRLGRWPWAATRRRSVLRPRQRRCLPHVPASTAGRSSSYTLSRTALPVSARRRAGPLGHDAGLLRRPVAVAGAADPRRNPAHRLAARRRRADVGCSWAAALVMAAAHGYRVALHARGDAAGRGHGHRLPAAHRSSACV